MSAMSGSWFISWILSFDGLMKRPVRGKKEDGLGFWNGCVS